MFILNMQNGLAVSSVNNPADPSYSPIYIDLDSTLDPPPPSPAVPLFLSLPAGFKCERGADGTPGGAILTFEGTTSSRWQVTLDNPPGPNTIWNSSVRVPVTNNVPSQIWIRANTVQGEVPVDDRSVSYKVSGQVEAV